STLRQLSVLGLTDALQGADVGLTRTDMLLTSLLLAAGLSRMPTTVEGRISLLEARQMLEAQQIWALRAELPPEAVRALADVQLHLQHDQEQEDKVRDLTQTMQVLQQRVAAVELLLQDKSLTESTRIPVAPMQ